MADLSSPGQTRKGNQHIFPSLSFNLKSRFCLHPYTIRPMMTDFEENCHFNQLCFIFLSFVLIHKWIWLFTFWTQKGPHLGQCSVYLPILCCWWGQLRTEGGKRFVRVIDVKQNPTAPSSAPPLLCNLIPPVVPTSSAAQAFCQQQLHSLCFSVAGNTKLGHFLVKRDECWNNKVGKSQWHQVWIVEPRAADMSFAKMFPSNILPTLLYRAEMCILLSSNSEDSCKTNQDH